MISLFFQNLFLPLPTWTLTQNNKPNKRLTLVGSLMAQVNAVVLDKAVDAINTMIHYNS